MPTDCKTGVGRIVWGHPTKPQKKTYQEGPQKGKPIIGEDGQPVLQWVFGVAFPKAEFDQMVWPFMAQEAATGYPNGTPPKFSWKLNDGDGVDSKGKPFNTREGYAGCRILTISSEAFAPPVVKFNPNARNYDSIPPEGIKAGDYVVLALRFVLNIPTVATHTPSLYVNPQIVELVGYGQEIVNTPDPMSLLGGQTYNLPPGASAAPVAPSTSMGYPQQPGGMPPMQQPGGMPPMQQPGGMPPMQQPGGYAPPVQPAPDFVHNAGMPPGGGYPPQQPMMPPGGGYPPQQPMMPPGGGYPPQQQPGGMPPMPGQMPYPPR